VGGCNRHQTWRNDWRERLRHEPPSGCTSMIRHPQTVLLDVCLVVTYQHYAVSQQTHHKCRGEFEKAKIKLVRVQLSATGCRYEQ
jgi:hypothetical protein